jgi:hypothetical protein
MNELKLRLEISKTIKNLKDTNFTKFQILSLFRLIELNAIMQSEIENCEERNNLFLKIVSDVFPS